MSLRDTRAAVAAKRDGKTLAPAEIEAFVEGYVRGEVADELAAAFLMAAFIRGLDPDETSALTRAMVTSGVTLPLERIDRPKVDKHSTGGVADGVTLVFVPVAAALGLAVAKLSGRGLGHTGGTLDKLESIPGLRTDLLPEELERQVGEIGCAVAAQSADLVPADVKLYALRDATETVASVPLIAASVMCKKLAVGSDLILLDVKCGSGAFMKTRRAAIELARACVALARGWGRRARAAVTDMSQPLGDAVGNSLDVAEAIAVLRGEKAGRLRDLSVVLAGEALSHTGGPGMGAGRVAAARAIDSGEALEGFRRMVEAQGGDPRVVVDPGSVLPQAPITQVLEAPIDGTVVAVDAEAIGRASAALGAGRIRKGDPIDPAVGLVVRAKIGDRLQVGQPIGEVHARTADAAAEASRRVLAALELSDGPAEPPQLILGWFDTEE